MASIELKNISKEFRLARGKQVRALEDINVRIEDGEFVALLGPSGCGKSTLLHMIAGLDDASAGTVAVDGLPPVELQRKHELGIAFQEHALLPWRSVEGNLQLPFQIAGLKIDEDRIRELIGLVGLRGFETARPSQLSGGMRQRVSIARAFCLQPRVLLLDEPFGALDPITRRSMNLELQRIWLEQRITTVMVTHTVEEAIFLADRVLVMSGRPGRVLSDVRVSFTRPRSAEIMRRPEFHHLADQLSNLLEPPDANR